MSSGGHPAAIYERTHCCSMGQLRVKPMKRGVFSGMCGEGGLFHDATAGSLPVVRSAMRGKLSLIGGRTLAFVLSLYFGNSGSAGGAPGAGAASPSIGLE